MTTTPVMTITDEQIAEIEALSTRFPTQNKTVLLFVDEVIALISRLRDAEKSENRLKWMINTQAIVWSMNGMDSPTVYSVSFNGMKKSEHEWYPSELEAIDAAMEQSK